MSPSRPSSLLGLLLLPLLLIGCGSEAKSTSDEDAPPALPVEVAIVERGNSTAQLSSTAALVAEDEATVVARTNGVVERILVEEGQYVKAGQTLVQLDDARLALEVQRAEASLRRLQRAFERMQTMYDKQLVSRETFDQARSDYETQKVAADLARLELTYTTIRAPISGWVSARHVKSGNMVQTHDPVFAITNLDPLRTELHVPERELAKLKKDQPATLSFDALPGQTFTGRVSLISPVVDPTTGTFKVTVEVRNPSRTLKPGMFARVQIRYDEHENTLLIPKAAIVEEDDAVNVFVVSDSIARQRAVTTGYGSSNDRIEVTDGLTVGEQVVVSGQTALRDSTTVQIIQ